MFKLNISLLDILKSACPNDTVIDVIPIMTYELGDLSKCLIYADRKNDETYNCEARLATCDLITQIILLCQMMKWNINDVIFDGIERFRESMLDVIEWKKEDEDN